jgi:hypothetical protein
MGFNMLFYIIFGTNLLTGGPVPVSVFLPILEFRRKGIPNGVQTEWNLRDDLSWTESNPEDLELKSGTPRGGHEAGGRAQGGRRAPHPRGPLVAPPTYFFRLYILLYPRNIRGSHETTFPPPQPSVPVRSHLGAFSGDLPEGESITEGFYINTIASPMKRE